MNFHTNKFIQKQPVILNIQDIFLTFLL